MPSFLKQEIEELADSNYERKSTKRDKNLRIIFEYFGLGRNKYCNSETLGKDNTVTRKRVLQILKKQIIGKDQKIKPRLPALDKIYQVIQQSLDSNQYAFYSDILLTLQNEKIIEGYLHPFGLLNFSKYFHFNQEFVVCTTLMDVAEKEDYRSGEEFIITKPGVQDRLKADILRILKLPGEGGKAGIIRLDSTVHKDEVFNFKLIDLKKILHKLSEVWCYEDENENFWYLVQDRENPIITALGKIRKAGGEHIFEKALLTKVIRKSLWRGNSTERAAKFPSEEIIQKYLNDSWFIDAVTYDGKYLLKDKLTLKNIELTDIDQGIKDFFQNRRVATFGEISESLRPLGKNLDLVLRSPLLVKIENIQYQEKKDREFTFITKVDNDEFTLASTIEDLIQGGSEDTDDLKKRKYPITQEQFEKAQKAFKEMGEKGEKLVHAYLRQQKTIINIDAVSENEPYAPYDFIVREVSGSRIYIDVKSTSGGFNRKIHISYSELLEMQKHENYQIYRVYEIGETEAYLKISENLKGFSKNIEQVFSKLPEGVLSKGISLLPDKDTIKFGDEILVENND